MLHCFKAALPEKRKTQKEENTEREITVLMGFTEP